MAKTDTFSCSVVTPERKLLEVDARFVAMPAHDGEIGVLVNRAPLVCKLGVGALRIEAPAGNRTLYIDGGFAQVLENRVSILTEDAREVADLDAAAASAALAEARSMEITNDEAYAARDRALRRARAMMKLAKQ